MRLSRRSLLQASATAVRPVAASAPARLPNIVFLISDDHSKPDLGCYGNASIRTPNLDRMAANGMRFERAYVSCPQCSPNRSSILTGCSPHTTATSRLHTSLPPWEATIIDALKDRGYFTSILRKHHQGAHFESRLDFYHGEIDFAKFFSALPARRPFFLQVGFTDPHRPYGRGSYPVRHDPQSVVVPPFLPDTRKVREDLADYYNAIARLDAQTGELLGELERRGLTENTMLVFTGDNGMPFPRAKGTLYEAGINVPLLVWWPGHTKAGAVNQSLVAHVDLPPTWLEAAGIAGTAKMQGRSLLGLLEGGAYRERECVFAERNWHNDFDPMRAVETKRHKLIYNLNATRGYRPIKDLRQSPSWESMVEEYDRSRLAAKHRTLFEPSRALWELYDLERDPEERRNLAGDAGHEETFEDLKIRLSNWMHETYDFLPPPYGNYPARRGSAQTYNLP
jgi:arylsulfatase A-like enzyme